jgi:cellobiose phosphorylase
MKGTQRLTVRQNGQLTTQLEFQSKKAESLILEQSENNSTIKQLREELKTHEAVEKELAIKS